MVSPSRATLRSCALVHRTWRPIAQRLLYATTYLPSEASLPLYINTIKESDHKWKSAVQKIVVRGEFEETDALKHVLSLVAGNLEEVVIDCYGSKMGRTSKHSSESGLWKLLQGAFGAKGSAVPRGLTSSTWANVPDLRRLELRNPTHLFLIPFGTTFFALDTLVLSDADPISAGALIERCPKLRSLTVLGKALDYILLRDSIILAGQNLQALHLIERQAPSDSTQSAAFRKTIGFLEALEDLTIRVEMLGGDFAWPTKLRTLEVTYRASSLDQVMDPSSAEIARDLGYPLICEAVAGMRSLESVRLSQILVTDEVVRICCEKDVALEASNSLFPCVIDAVP